MKMPISGKGANVNTENMSNIFEGLKGWLTEAYQCFSILYSHLFELLICLGSLNSCRVNEIYKFIIHDRQTHTKLGSLSKRKNFEKFIKFFITIYRNSLNYRKHSIK